MHPCEKFILSVFSDSSRGDHYVTTKYIDDVEALQASLRIGPREKLVSIVGLKVTKFVPNSRDERLWHTIMYSGERKVMWTWFIGYMWDGLNTRNVEVTFLEWAMMIWDRIGHTFFVKKPEPIPHIKLSGESESAYNILVKECTNILEYSYADIAAICEKREAYSIFVAQLSRDLKPDDDPVKLMKTVKKLESVFDTYKRNIDNEVSHKEMREEIELENIKIDEWNTKELERWTFDMARFEWYRNSIASYFNKALK